MRPWRGIAAMILAWQVLGFHPLLLPTFALELLPVTDLLPTWTGCVAVVVALRKRQQGLSQRPPHGPREIKRIVDDGEIREALPGLVEAGVGGRREDAGVFGVPLPESRTVIVLLSDTYQKLTV